MNSPGMPTRPEILADEELLVIREASALLGKSLDQRFVIREILHLLSELLGLNRGRVAMPDADGTLCIAYAYGLSPEEIKSGRYQAGEGVTGRVMASGQMTIIQDVDAEPWFVFRAVERDRLPEGTVSFIALPIEQGGQVLGVLGVHRLRDRPRPLARDLHILKIAATLIAQAIRLNRLIQERTARLESENHFYNPVHTGLLDLGLEPHLMTEDVLVGMLELVWAHRDRIRTDIVMPRVRWKR